MDPIGLVANLTGVMLSFEAHLHLQESCLFAQSLAFKECVIVQSLAVGECITPNGLT
jgi:hypothetical protein